MKRNPDWRTMVESQSPEVQERIGLHSREFLERLSDEELQAIINEAKGVSKSADIHPALAFQQAVEGLPSEMAGRLAPTKDEILADKIREIQRQKTLIEAAETEPEKTARLLKERLEEAKIRKAEAELGMTERKTDILGGEPQYPIYQTGPSSWTNIPPGGLPVTQPEPATEEERLRKLLMAETITPAMYNALKPEPPKKYDIKTLNDTLYKYTHDQDGNPKDLTEQDRFAIEQMAKQSGYEIVKRVIEPGVKRGFPFYYDTKEKVGWFLKKKGTTGKSLPRAQIGEKTSVSKRTKNVKDKYGFNLCEIRKGYKYIGNDKWQKL